jgi:uncharacterized protein (TIGR00251 family)
VIIFVEAHPSSKREAFEKIDENHFKIYTKEPPKEGKANKSIIEILSKNLKVPKSYIVLKKGEKGENKIFEIKI